MAAVAVGSSPMQVPGREFPPRIRMFAEKSELLPLQIHTLQRLTHMTTGTKSDSVLGTGESGSWRIKVDGSQVASAAKCQRHVIGGARPFWLEWKRRARKAFERVELATNGALKDVIKLR